MKLSEVLNRITNPQDLSDYHRVWCQHEVQMEVATVKSYINNLLTDTSPVMCTAGKHIGKTINVKDARLIDKYVIHKDEICFGDYINRKCLTNDLYYKAKEKNEIVCFNFKNSMHVYDQYFYDLSELCCPSRDNAPNHWFPKEDVVVLSEEYYDEDYKVHKSHATLIIDNSSNEEMFILVDDAVDVVNLGSQQHLNCSTIVACNYYGCYYLIFESAIPEDMDDYFLIEDLHRDENNLCFYFDEDNMPSRQPARNKINEYHETPEGEYFKTTGNDIDPLSKYTIGFEIEKTDVDGYSCEGDIIEEQPLFAGWETDSSCGVEGITNVYSLDNLRIFRAHVHSSDYLEEDTSPRCGGHINISDTTDTTEYWHMRAFLGLIWSLWRKRLNNEYSRCNKKANPYKRSENKYSSLLEKRKGFGRLYELRLPNRVDTGNQLINRFELMQNFIRCVDNYKNEEWITTKSEDKYYGIPDWLTNKLTADIGISNDVLKQTADELRNISKTTFNRTYHMITINKDVLCSMYSSPLSLFTTVLLAYYFQEYIDCAEDKIYHKGFEWVRNKISEYL